MTLTNLWYTFLLILVLLIHVCSLKVFSLKLSFEESCHILWHQTSQVVVEGLVEDADDAAARKTMESSIPREGIEFFLGRPLGFVGGIRQPPCIT